MEAKKARRRFLKYLLSLSTPGAGSVISLRGNQFPVYKSPSKANAVNDLNLTGIQAFTPVNGEGLDSPESIPIYGFDII
jgi:hypothetical protein